MGYYQLDPATNTINGAFSLPQPDNPNYADLPDTDPRVVAWNAPTKAQVDAERDRRINLGFSFNAVAYQSRPDKGDFENISGMGALAIEALRDGTGTAGNLRWFDPNNDFGWIANNNSVTPMDAPTMVAFGKTAAAHKLAHIFAASAIKAMSPIPADYASNATYWPTN